MTREVDWLSAHRKQTYHCTRCIVCLSKCSIHKETETKSQRMFVDIQVILLATDSRVVTSMLRKDLNITCYFRASDKSIVHIGLQMSKSELDLFLLSSRRVQPQLLCESCDRPQTRWVTIVTCCVPMSTGPQYNVRSC